MLIFALELFVFRLQLLVLFDDQLFQSGQFEGVQIGKGRALSHRERSISDTKSWATQFLLNLFTPRSVDRSCALVGASRSLPAASKAVLVSERPFHSLLAAR